MTFRKPTHASAALLVLAALVAALLVASSGAHAAKKQQKVVALTPFTANTLVNAGVRPTAIGAMAVGHKGISPKLKGIKQLPLSHPNGPNMEQIAKINPDVVLSAQTWRKGAQTMRDLDITVREMDPANAGSVVRQVKKVGYTYGSRKATDKLVRKINKEVRTATKSHPITKRPSVLLVLGVGRTPYVFLNNSWGGSIAKAAGANLLGGDLKGSGGFVKVSDEYVVQQDPDIIIGVPHGNANDVDAIRSHMLNNPAWSTTKAVKSGQVLISMNDSLLQPNIDVGHTIKRLRTDYLKNW